MTVGNQFAMNQLNGRRNFSFPLVKEYDVPIYSKFAALTLFLVDTLPKSMKVFLAREGYALLLYKSCAVFSVCHCDVH